MSGSKKIDFKEIKNRARELRNNMTDSEILLWKKLKERRLSGFKFLRQHPILYKGNLIRLNYFIVDFYCSEKKAVIELDGPIHDDNEEYDQFRDSELKELGFNILRIKNEELMNMQQVKRTIFTFLNKIT